MKYLKEIAVVLLVASLVMNIFLLSKLTTIEDSVNSITQYQMDIMSNVNEQTNNVTTILEDFKREQSWISTVQWDIREQNLENGEAQLRFEWQLKELGKDSLVYFHYKYGESTEYQSIPATQTGDGLFDAIVPINIKLEPEWFVYTSISENNHIEEESMNVHEEKMREEMNKNNFLYYITVSDGDVLKSSEVDTVYLGELSTRYYGALDTNIYIDEDNYNITVFEQKSSSDIFVKEAYLLKYMNQKVVDEEKLKTSRYEDEDPYAPMREYMIHFSKKGEDFNKLVLKVIYSNNTSFEKEIYSK